MSTISRPRSQSEITFPLPLLFCETSICFIGQWGPIRFDTGIFLGFVAGTLASVVESVGDYHACARVCQEPDPPAHATNRGTFIEGFCCFVGGFLGGGVSVTTYSQNIAVIGITGVNLRRLWVPMALISLEEHVESVGTVY